MSVLRWYNVINHDDFIESGLISKELTLDMGEFGEKDVLVTQGVLVSILFDGIFLSINMNDKNPFFFENYGVYVDPDGEIWVGFLNDT